MHLTVLPVFFCTVLIISLWPLVQRWISARYVLLIFSLAFLLLISPVAVAVLLVFSLFVYTGGKLLHQQKGRMILYSTITLCLLPLVVYKVLDARPTEDFTAQPHFLLEVIGISYFTFNGLSYLFDIRKGYLLPEKNYAHLLLFLCYFPCITAGPLHRYKFLNQQFSTILKPDGENFSRGFRLILWGLFKNLVLAQRFKTIVEYIIDNPLNYQGVFVLVGGLAFFFQLYCDFSAYVDIAMGFSRMMGIQLSPNFSNRVYLSSSRSDFWKGWHQTLNTWFRDYLFFPLVKGRARKTRIDMMLIITFVMIGIWHELSYRFLFWGLLNGLWILAESKIRPRLPAFTGKMWIVLGVLYHLSLASFMAVIFRTTDLSASLQALFSTNKQQFVEDGLVRQLIFLIPLFLVADQFNRVMKNDTIDIFIGTKKRWYRWSFYFFIGLTIMAFGQLADQGPYYARF